MWSTANVARACRAGLAGFVLVILSTSLGEATYGPRTKIGNNYQQWSSQASPNGVDVGACTGEGCYIIFQRPPQQKPLIIQHVSCFVAVSSNGLSYGFVLTRKGQDFLDRRTHLVPVNTRGTIWIVNTPVMHLIKSGERPILHFAGINPDWGSLECNIAGKLQQ